MVYCRDMRLLLTVLLVHRWVDPVTADDGHCGVVGGSSLPTPRRSTRAMVGGLRAPSGSWPWLVSIRHWSGTKSEHSCGGTLIHDRLVVTAAHCVLSGGHPSMDARRRDGNDSLLFEIVDPSRLRVVTGEHILSKVSRRQKTHRVQKIFVHPRYGNVTHSDMAYDIAILKIDGSSNVASPICLPSRRRGRREKNSRDCFVAGWGRGDDDQLTDVLHERQMPIQRSSHCRFEYGNEFVDRAMICTGIASDVQPAGPCNGDSGGALACTTDSQVFTLDGVISSGSLICMRKHAVATRVDNSQIWQWINDTVDSLAYTLPSPPSDKWRRTHGGKTTVRERYLARLNKNCSAVCDTSEWSAIGSYVIQPRQLGSREEGLFDNSQPTVLSTSAGTTASECVQLCCDECQSCRGVQYDLRRSTCQLLSENYCTVEDRSRVKEVPIDRLIYHITIDGCRKRDMQ